MTPTPLALHRSGRIGYALLAWILGANGVIILIALLVGGVFKF